MRPFQTVAATLAALSLATCGGRASAPPPAPRSGCLPGMTALAPRTLAPGYFSGLSLVDGDVVATGEDLVRLPLSGDAPLTITHLPTMRGLVVVGDTAYFSADHTVGAPDPQGKQSSTSALFSVPLAGGTPTLFVDQAFDVDGAVTDGQALYFKGYATGVTRVSVPDGAVTVLPLPDGVFANALAVHGGTLYAAGINFKDMGATRGVIARVSTTGGAAQTLVANIGNPWSLVADAGGLFWVQDAPIGVFTSPTVVRAGLDGKNPRMLLAHGASSLVVVGGDLYMAGEGISKVPIAGGDEVALVAGLKAPGELTISDGQAVWVDPVSQAKSDPTVPALMTTCW